MRAAAPPAGTSRTAGRAGAGRRERQERSARSHTEACSARRYRGATAGARRWAAWAPPGIPTLIFIGALDDWTPAADCSDKVAGWGDDGPSIELVIYPGAYHGFYYRHLQPGITLFDHWLEYNGAAADNADHRLREFLDRHLKADSGNGN